MSGDTLAALAARIAELAAFPPGAALPESAEHTVAELLSRLEDGEVRAAQRDHDGCWRAVPWVKQGILVAFRVGKVVALPVYYVIDGVCDAAVVPQATLAAFF